MGPRPSFHNVSLPFESLLSEQDHFQSDANNHSAENISRPHVESRFLTLGIVQLINHDHKRIKNAADQLIKQISMLE
jgi:hypothetical protein